MLSINLAVRLVFGAFLAIQCVVVFRQNMAFESVKSMLSDSGHASKAGEFERWRGKAIAKMLLILAFGCTQPVEPMTVYRQGVVAASDGNQTVLTQCLDQLPELPDHEPIRSMLQGHLYRLQNRPQMALREFSRANQDVRTREDSYFEAARLSYELKQFADAIKLLRQVIEWNPDRIEAHRLLAAACYDIGAMDEAINSLEEVIRRTPDDFRPHYMKATILQDFERFGDAETAFREAASRVPGDSRVDDEVRLGWGDCLIRLRKYDEAIKALENAGDWPDVLAKRSQAQFALRRFEEARASAAAALSRQPVHPDASVVMAQLEEREGKTDDAIRRLEEVAKQYPMELPPLLRLADLLAAAGRTEESLKIRSRSGELADLRAQFSKAHQDAVRDLTNASLRLQLAQIADKLGEYQLAAGWYLAAVGMAPNDAAILNQWNSFLHRHPEFSPTTAASATSGGQTVRENRPAATPEF